MMSGIIDLYHQHQLGRGFSPRTANRRTGTLRAFGVHLHPTPLVDATTQLVEEWVHQFRAPRTRHAYLSDLRGFYRWAQKRALVDVNPCDRVDPIKVPRGLPRPVDAGAIAKIIELAPSWTVAVSVGFAAYAGLRRAEIATIDARDINLASDPPLLVVRNGKGGKDRAVPVHPLLVELLRTAPRSGPIVGLHPDTVGKMVADHLRWCGVDATCHALRHTFGTEAARATAGDLLLVADLMGHDSPTTTVGYTRLVGRDGAAAVRAMFDAA